MGILRGIQKPEKYGPKPPNFPSRNQTRFVQKSNPLYSIEAKGLRSAPVLAGNANSDLPAGMALAFRKNNNGQYAARAEAKNLRLQGNVVAIETPAADGGVYVGRRDGKNYFYTCIGSD